MRKGEETRTRILDVAEAAVLQKGFGGTSIEELIAETGITKSGFFYHFRDKNELAKALLNRYIENDERIYDEIFSRARDLTDDPLQSFLLGLKLLSELLSD
ncbi:TetR/AcrR family transcriptional regulator, partial [Rhizobium ruizarguesonis]